MFDFLFDADSIEDEPFEETREGFEELTIYLGEGTSLGPPIIINYYARSIHVQ